MEKTKERISEEAPKAIADALRGTEHRPGSWSKREGGWVVVTEAGRKLAISEGGKLEGLWVAGEGVRAFPPKPAAPKAEKPAVPPTMAPSDEDRAKAEAKAKLTPPKP